MGILVDGRGAFSGLVFTMMADFSDMALIEAAVEEETRLRIGFAFLDPSFSTARSSVQFTTH